MAEYTIIIEGYESGLTEGAVKENFQNMYGAQDVTITVAKE